MKPHNLFCIYKNAMPVSQVSTLHYKLDGMFQIKIIQLLAVNCEMHFIV